MTGPSPWPRNAAFGDGGLWIGGQRAADLATSFGTPLMVLDEEDLRARCRAHRDAFGDVLFAVKAFPSRFVAQAALDEGLGLLAATGGELAFCLGAGADPARIALHGNNKSDAEIAAAVEAGVRFLVADSADELDRIDRAARDAGRIQQVLVRVIPGVDAHTHAYVDTGRRDTKFGIPAEQALDALKRADALPGVEPAGIHVHIGSQVLEVQPYLAAVDVALDLVAEARRGLGLELPTLDLGGGFGVTYRDERPPEPAVVGALLQERVSSGSRDRRIEPPAVVVEPGRAIVANPILTLYRVGTIKEVPGVRTYLSVDGGMSDNIRPALYGSRHTFALANRTGSDDVAPVTVAGRHCESGDILGEDVPLPADVERGDVVAVAATGAYAYAMASSYNRVGRPAVVALRDGEPRLILRREEDGDLDRLEASVGPIPEVAPPAGVVVRPARPGDARSFLALWSGVVAERRFVRTEHVRQTLRAERKRFRHSWTEGGAHLVAVEGHRVVGQLTAARDASSVNRHVATLGLAVAPDRRGQGIGSALLAECVRWARQVRVEKLALSVYPENRAALALYAKFGFVEEGRLSGHSKKSYGYEDEIVMGRWLPGSR